LRGTGWPDPRADLGEQQFSWAFAPLPTGTGIGEIEQMWRRFAHETSVRLFTSDDAAVLVTACKPAQDGDGIVVRVRECDGKNAELRLRCGGRMRDVVAIDGVEEPLDEPVRVEGESLTAPLPAYSLRSFRVRF
jgi:alpha-mannosidase